MGGYFEKSDKVWSWDVHRMGGVLCFGGTRLPISHIALMLHNGEKAEHIIADYPYLSQDDLIAAGEFGFHCHAP